MTGTETEGWGHFGELFGRAIFIGLGLLILRQYGLSEPFTDILGLTFTIGPIVTVGPVELGLKILLNRATVRITGKEVFYVEQKNIQAQTVIGHVHGNVIQQPAEGSQEKEEDWTIARNFTLKGEGDTKEFQLTMKQGGSLKGYVEADGDVWAYVLTKASLRSFRDGNEFGSLWEAEREDYAKVDFTAPKTNTYYFIITSDIEEDEEYYEDDDDDEPNDVGVELRLSYRDSSDYE